MQYCIGNIRVAFDGDTAASRVLEDTPAVRGMIEKVHHLVRVVDEK